MNVITYPNSKVHFEKRTILIGAMATISLSFFLAIMLDLTRVLSIILAAQVVIFLFAFRQPVWAMASLIVGQFTTGSYQLAIFGSLISIRLIWTIFALLLLIPLLRRQGGIELGRKARSVILPAIIFAIIITVSNIVNADTQGTWAYLRQMTSALTVLILLPACIKDERDLKLLAIVALITCTLSAVAALLQKYSGLGLPDFDLLGGGITGGRVVGLTESDIHLGFDFPLVLLPTISVLLTQGIQDNSRKYLIPIVLLMVAGLYFSYTRSGIYSLAPGILAIIILMKSKAKKEIIFVAIILCVIFLIFVFSSGSRYSKGFTNEQSAAGRLVLWDAGVKIAMDHPVFGVGPYKFTTVSKDYAAYISESLMTNVNAGSDLGNEQPHNDFINVWLSFGTPALIAYLWVVIVIIINFYSAYRRANTKFSRSLFLGYIAAIASYIVNAATHNVMDAVLFLWILGGLSIAAHKVISRQSKKIEAY